MMQRLRPLVPGICLVGLLSLPGCGESLPDPPKTVPVSGTVTMGGEPLENVMVIFTPADADNKPSKNPGEEKKAKPTVSGRTDANGKYELQLIWGGERISGAVPGDYKVRISSMVPEASVDDRGNPVIKPGAAAAMIEQVPEQYSNGTKTILKATVGESGGTQDFPLESK